MASVLDNIKYGGHTIAESTLMLGSFSGGHFYNVVNEEQDVDNGVPTVIKPENWLHPDVFKMVAPKATEKIAVVINAPKIYQEYTSMDQHEDNYYIGQGEEVRAYEAYETDRFSVSAEAFADDAVLNEKMYVTVVPDTFKYTTSTEEPTGVAFVGYILHKTNNGLYTIMIKRNRDVEA